MQRTWTGLPAVLALLVLLAIGALVFASLAVVFAIVAPLGALWFLGLRLRIARMLWRSQGRLPGVSGLRIVGAERTRALAVAEVLAGTSALVLSAAPGLGLFVSLPWAIVAVGVALLLGAVARAVRRRALTDLPQVEVLPPE